MMIPLLTLVFSCALAQAPSPPATAPASQPAPPLLSGPKAEEDNPGKLTLVHRTFDGRVESAGAQADAVAIGMLDLTPEQRAKYNEINAARLSVFDQVVRSNYGLILELASLQGETDMARRVDVMNRFQIALQPYTDRGTFYQEMWPALDDPQRQQVQKMLQEYRDARMDSLKREAGTDNARERTLAIRDRLDAVGQMIRESVERQVGLERENFEQIADELGLTPEQRNQATAIFQATAVKRFQNLEVTAAERSAAFAEFSKILTAGQKQKLFGVLVRRYQTPAASRPATTRPATQPASRPGKDTAAQTQTYKAPAGSFEVTERMLTFTDSSRKRDVPVEMYLPKSASGPAPLIVFSPGWGGSRDGYGYLGRHWASHGYAVVVLTHAGSDTDFARKAAGDGAGAALKLAQALRESVNDPNNWSNRALDVTFVLDELTRRDKASGDELFGRLDLARVGVAGHSFGAHTTMLLVGATVDMPETPGASFMDRRCTCGVAMSSQGDGHIGLNARSWANVRAPMMYLTGTRDYELGSGDASDRRVAFDRTPADTADDQYLITIKAAEHMAFSDNPRGVMGEALQRNPAHHQWILEATTMFWDAYLRGDEKSRAWLKSDALPALSNHECTLERK